MRNVVKKIIFDFSKLHDSTHYSQPHGSKISFDCLAWQSFSKSHWLRRTLHSSTTVLGMKYELFLPVTPHPNRFFGLVGMCGSFPLDRKHQELRHCRLNHFRSVQFIPTGMEYELFWPVTTPPDLFVLVGFCGYFPLDLRHCRVNHFSTLHISLDPWEYTSRTIVVSYLEQLDFGSESPKWAPPLTLHTSWFSSSTSLSSLSPCRSVLVLLPCLEWWGVQCNPFLIQRSQELVSGFETHFIFCSWQCQQAIVIYYYVMQLKMMLMLEHACNNDN